MMIKKLSFISLSAGLFTLLAAAPSSAFDVYLAAKQFTKPMPDGSEVVMWGFAADQDNDLVTDAGEAPSSPGPMITVPPGDNTLNIHLRNDLGVPVSLVIPSLTTALSPVRFIDGQGRSRVQSFTTETAPGQVNTYSWSARPGSFIYHSGTHMPVQVPMGLYGGVKKDAADGQAYDRGDTAYQNEVTLFYSEIDPVLNAAIAGGTYGTAAYPGTVNYSPKFFLVNGEPYTNLTLPIQAGTANETALIRFFNAGVESHSVVTQGLYMKLLSEDGNLYPFPKEQYSALLPASKTAEAVITPQSGGDYPVYDRRLFIAGNGTSPGGMFSVLRVSSTLMASGDSYSMQQDAQLSVPAPGILANDAMPDQGTTAELVTNVSNGTLVLNPDGSFTYTPAQGFAGTDSFSYRIVNGNLSSTATVSITVELAILAPVAADDDYWTDEDAAMGMAAPGVLANDTLNGTNPRAVLVTGPSHGALVLNADGSCTYTPSADYNGADSFTYMVVTDALSSSPATVSMTVSPVNDSPVAADDTASTFANTPAVINVLANDSDIDGDALTTILATSPKNGTVAVNADQSVTYTPNGGFAGTDSFTYSASDGSVLSAPATVTVNVSEQPQAAGDSYAVNEDTNLTVAAPGVLGNDQFTGAASAVLVTPPSSGSLVLNSDGSFTYTPSANYSGAVSFTYKLISGGIESTLATVELTVNPVNDGPVAAFDSASTAYNTPIAVNALANDTDADGDTLSVGAITGAPSNGSVAINPDNTITYTPNNGFSGTDRFYYTATDGTLSSNVARVTVTVKANQLPIAVIDYATTTVNTPVVIDLAANDYDLDGTIVRSTLTILTVPGRGGSVVNNGDGTVNFTPLSGFAGSDYFYYNIKDNYGATSRSAKVTVKVVR